MDMSTVKISLARVLYFKRISRVRKQTDRQINFTKYIVDKDVKVELVVHVKTTILEPKIKKMIQ
jgi:hypothetical protein